MSLQLLRNAKKGISSMRYISKIYFIFLLLMIACASSNTKVIETFEKDQEVSIVFSGYKHVKLKKASGFNKGILYWITKLDTLNLDSKYTDGVLFNISKRSVNNSADFYSHIADCTIKYNQDSTMLCVEGFIKSSQYIIVKQIGNISIELTYFSPVDSIVVSTREMVFLENLALNILILNQ